MRTLLKSMLALVFVAMVGITVFYFSGSYSFLRKKVTEVEIDANEKINYEDIMKSSKTVNKDYSNSVFYTYYEMLKDDQKDLYNNLIVSINNIQPFYEPTTPILVDDVKEAFYAVVYDHPELFWLENKYSCEYVADTNEVTKVNLNYFDLVNNFKTVKEKFDNELDELVTKARKYNLDYAKEKFVHDEIIKMVNYNTESRYNQSAYGALIDHEAACAGYAKLFQIVMVKLGIPTYYVTGIINEDHAWNLIELDDGFYHIDLTWDDQKDRIIYKYFNIPEELIIKDHEKTELSVNLPKAEGYKYINIYTTLIE